MLFSLGSVMEPGFAGNQCVMVKILLAFFRDFLYHSAHCLDWNFESRCFGGVF